MRRRSRITHRWYEQRRDKNGRFLPKGVRGVSPKKKHPEVVAFKLLKTLVPPEDFHGVLRHGYYGPDEVTLEGYIDVYPIFRNGKSVSEHWRIILGSTVGNIWEMVSSPFGLQVGVTKCGLPVAIDPKYIKRYLPDQSTRHNPEFEYTDSNIWRYERQLPMADLHIGQYLSLKHDYTNFLSRCF